MRNYLCAAASAASVLAFAPAAQAAITLVPGSTVSAAVNPTQTSISFDDNMVASGSFTELLNFNLDAASSVAINFGTSFEPIDFTNVFISALGSANPVFTLPGTAGNPNPESILGSTNLGVGSYSLNILGINSGGAGTLGGTVSATATAAVPEPATWAMMLLGFGAIGFGMRRRKAAQPQVRFNFA